MERRLEGHAEEAVKSGRDEVRVDMSSAAVPATQRRWTGERIYQSPAGGFGSCSSHQFSGRFKWNVLIK